MKKSKIYNSAQLIELIGQIGFLPLLDSGIRGFSAEEMVDEECRYIVFPDGGWDWPLWKWKGEIITEGGHVYGKFFAGKAGFISREWWPHFCNYRRSTRPAPTEGSIEETILLTLETNESLITRQLRTACGFNGSKMRSKFDSYVTRLQMATRIVTENFIYPTDRHGHNYGWGWSLLTTPELLYGKDACQCDCSPQESFKLICQKLHDTFSDVTESQIVRILK